MLDASQCSLIITIVSPVSKKREKLSFIFILQWRQINPRVKSGRHPHKVPDIIMAMSGTVDRLMLQAAAVARAAAVSAAVRLLGAGPPQLPPGRARSRITRTTRTPIPIPIQMRRRRGRQARQLFVIFSLCETFLFAHKLAHSLYLISHNNKQDFSISSHFCCSNCGFQNLLNDIRRSVKVIKNN